MRSRLLVASSLAAAGALAVLLAAGRVWGSATATGTARQHLVVTGRQVSAALPALALALLALAVAVLAARGLLRRLVATAGAVAAAATVVVAVRAHHDVGAALLGRAFGVAATSLPTHDSGWWLLAGIGAVVAAVAFAAVAVAGGRWQGMGARYDAPKAVARQVDPAVATWDALDRGDDPTA
jgi:uncharacterized membrane protein (TIGR02234 family)